MVPAAVAGPTELTAMPPNRTIDANAPIRKRLVAKPRGTLNPPGKAPADAIRGHPDVRPLCVLLRAQYDGRPRVRDAQGGDHRNDGGERERGDRHDEQRGPGHDDLGDDAEVRRVDAPRRATERDTDGHTDRERADR